MDDSEGTERFHQAADKVLGKGNWKEQFFYCEECQQWSQVIAPKILSFINVECEDCGGRAVLDQEP